MHFHIRFCLQTASAAFSLWTIPAAVRVVHGVRASTVDDNTFALQLPQLDRINAQAVRLLAGREHAINGSAEQALEQSPPPDEFLAARHLVRGLNDAFHENTNGSGFPGVLMRMHPDDTPLEFKCGSCNFGADCKVSATLYHREWSVARDAVAGPVMTFQAGQIMVPYGDTSFMFGIVFDKRVLVEAIRCAYATDGDSDTRLGYGCGCDVFSHKEACHNNRTADSTDIVACHCTTTSQEIKINEFPDTCYWKGPAFINADGRRGVNEMADFVRHRLNLGAAIGYQKKLCYWTEVIIGAYELTQLLTKNASTAILAFAIPRLCDVRCVGTLLQVREKVSLDIPVIAFDDMSAAFPFRAIHWW